MSEFLDKINALANKEALQDLNDKMDFQFAISQATSNEEKAKIWDEYKALKNERFEQRLRLNKILFEKPVYKPIEFID